VVVSHEDVKTLVDARRVFKLFVRVAGTPVGAGALRLPGRAGALRIAWRVPARTSSFDGVTAALQRAYRKRGAKPPG